MINLLKTKTKLLFIIAVTFAIGVLTSCDEEGAEYIDDLDTIITRYDESFDFSKVKTYVMPDTVIYVSEEDINSEKRAEFDAAVLKQLALNFEKLGYTRLAEDDDSVDPDVIVTATVIENDVYAVYPYPWYDYWYWFDWPFWGLPGIGPGWYPQYPPYWGGYSYTTGSLVVDMMQTVPIEEDKQIPVVWNGIFNGIVSIGLSDRMLDGIDQMFEQSPYLSKE